MKTIAIILLLTLAVTPLFGDEEESEGDEKIKDTIKKIEEAEKEKEQDSGGWDDDGEEEDGCSDACFELGCQFFGEFCLDIFGEIFWQYAAGIRFAPYPYAEAVDFDFTILAYPGSMYQKIASLQTGADFSMHFDGTYGNTNRLTAQLTGLQLNIFNQTIFSTSESLSFVSCNGGLSLLIGGFDLSGFAGVYIVTTTGDAVFSLGLSSRVFFPRKLYLDVYGLYAFLGEGILHVITTLNLAIWRFSVGLGYNVNFIVGDVYSGPCLKVNFWL
jgi:hypothetical protein